MTTPPAIGLLLGSAAACGVLAVVLHRRDARDLRVAWLGASAAVLALAWVGTALTPGHDLGRALRSVLGAVGPAIVAPAVGVLGVAGLARRRVEGPGRGWWTTIAFAVVLLLVNLAAIPAVILGRGAVAGLGWAGLLLSTWASLLLVGYAGYSWVYQRRVRTAAPSYILTLGSTLAGGQVPPVLAERIDRAVALYQVQVAAGQHPLLVMSGGKGGSGRPAEAAAMADYAQRLGVPATDILREERSTTTEENFLRTAELVASDPRLGAGAVGLAVTSGFHALRAGMLARRLGLPLQVAGARSSDQEWWSSLLRELTLGMGMHRGRPLVEALVLTLPIAVLFVLASTL